MCLLGSKETPVPYLYGITLSLIYTTKFLACVCECATDVTSPCLHRSSSCGTLSPTCKVGLGQLHVYIDELLRGNLNADAMREARARESREEGETRWRANTDAMREARERQIADRGWSHICPLIAFRKYCCSRPNAHTKVAEASEATCKIYSLWIKLVTWEAIRWKSPTAHYIL